MSGGRAKRHTPVQRHAPVRRHGWLVALLKALVLLPLWALIPAALFVAMQYGTLLGSTQAPESLRRPLESTPSRILSARGLVIGGLERGGGEWVAFDDLAPELVRLALASEDARFFQHQGLNPFSVLRAALANRRAGSTVQGGSTITQQLAKTWTSRQRTLERKLEELAIARHIEARFSKVEIFEAWINQIYFGAGATGIGAAARIFFETTPAELTLAQSALLVAQIPSPGSINPFRQPQAALNARQTLLERVRLTGVLSAEAIDQALETPLGLAVNRDERVVMPGLERAVWAELEALDPQRDWRRGGLEIQTGLDLVRQAHATRELGQHLEALDRRQGLRSTLATLEPGSEEAFDQAWQAQWGERPHLVPARVVALREREMVVWAGEEQVLRPAAWEWAVPWSLDARNHGETLERPAEDFAVGDILLLSDEGLITQFPMLELAFSSMELGSGAVEAHLGGYEAQRSHFDRVIQGCRQPGSTFKPFVYSAALDRGMSAATLLRDGPVRIELGPNDEWRPRNADGDFSGHITLWRAFASSRNLPALTIGAQLGAPTVTRRARELGLTTPMRAVESLPLGSNCVHPAELLAAYATFARSGAPAAGHFVRHIRGVSGFAADDPSHPRLDAVTRSSSFWEHAQQGQPRVVSEENAFVVAWLMSEVVRAGTAAGSSLGTPFAGKTGTTNTYDAWFAGFTGQEASVLWIGPDRNSRPLGRRENGSRTALPAWAAAQLLPRDPAGQAVPIGTPLLPREPHNIDWAAIDPETGELAAPDRPQQRMPFVAGTAPTRQSQSQAERDRVSIERLEREF